MQQVKLDGTPDGSPVAYALPAQQEEPELLSANAQGGRVAFLWKTFVKVPSEQAPEDYEVVDFASTDESGTHSTPAEVENYGAHSPVGSSELWLQVTSAGSWLAVGILHPNAPSLWEATAGSTIAGWSALSPTIFESEAFGLLGSTLMLTGSDCTPVNSSCTASFKLQRYSAASLAANGPPISLSPNIQSIKSAMGPVGDAMALLWTETQSPGQLFRASIKEDGTFAQPIGSVQSAIIPKVVVQSADGGALLIGTIVTVSGSGTVYQVVAQRLDANLNLIENPLPLADGQSEDADTFETRLSSDGKQMLTTYHQLGARFRVLNTNGCN